MKRVLTLLVFVACGALAKEPLPTAEKVEVEKYLGKWYSISQLPQFFTRKCIAQTADYTLKDAASIYVKNTCIEKNNKISGIEGVAVVVNSQTNAELEVTFDSFWTRLFNAKGDYTIIKLSDDYSLSLVGSKDRKSLWLLSRTPTIDTALRDEYLNHAKALGFDLSKIEHSVF